MLPSSKTSLMKSGWTPRWAVFTMMCCFLGGVIGIQVLSNLLHRFLPSHVVDCDHTHKDEEAQEEPAYDDSLDGNSEDRPLLSRELSYDEHIRPQIRKAQTEIQQRPSTSTLGIRGTEKASIRSKIAQRMSSFISDSKQICDEGGNCLGYSNPCGNECYRVVNPNRNKAPQTPTSTLQSSQHSHTPANPRHHSQRVPTNGSTSGNGYGSLAKRKYSTSSDDSDTSSQHHQHMRHSTYSHDQASSHHHHVASNSFLSIGLQSSIAIALHKLPEGFITYATNHANPRLGVSIFMALFIHNITEGFALALPLYLALNSRLKAMIWASILGGASQPAGAGLAALWFKVAQSRDMIPSEGVYGVMFAITAGIMTNVALQLLSESLNLTHHKALCIAMVFLGMGILGFSNALTAT